MIIGILAISENYAIGKDGKLPWHYPEDLKFFKAITTGNAIVMGANTWRSIGRPLPNRVNIVLTRAGAIETPPEVIKLSDRDEVLKFAQTFDGDIFVIGGAQIFIAFADLIEKWIVTVIPEWIEDADTFMPANFLDGFEIEDRKEVGEGLPATIMRRKTESGVKS